MHRSLGGGRVLIVPSIRTRRLILYPATVELLEAERDPGGELSDLLQADVASWPPPLNDEASRAWMIDLLRSHPDIGPWGMYYFLLRREGTLPLAIGNGGFKGAPSADGTVEIGYSVVETHHRRGYGAEAAAGLVRRAFEDPSVRRVIAETFPHLLGSIGVLRKVGFRRIGEGSEPGAILFELRREDWERAPKIDL